MLSFFFQVKQLFLSSLGLLEVEKPVFVSQLEVKLTVVAYLGRLELENPAFVSEIKVKSN